MERKKWEYLRAPIPVSQYNDMMRQFGMDGWEAYCVVDDGRAGWIEIHLKREILSTKVDDVKPGPAIGVKKEKKPE